MDDMAAYEPIERRPVEARFRGYEVLTNPPPSSGGILIGYSLGSPRAPRRPAAAWSRSSRRSRPPTRGAPTTSTRACTTRPTSSSSSPPTSTRSRSGSAPASGSAATAAPAGPAGPARLDHPHRRARRRGQLRVGHLLERDRLGGRGPRDRGAPQQHARGGGPQPAGIPPDPAGPPGELDDVADARPARRGGRARPGKRGLQPDPLGDPAGGGQGARGRDGRG